MQLSLHNITKVELTNIVNRKGGGEWCPEYKYDVRDILLTDSDGNEFRVTLFGQHDEDGTLKVKKAKK